MKKLLLAFAVCSCFTGYAQEGVEQEYSIMVADVDIMQIDGLEYIEIVGQQKLLNPFKFNIVVEFGQKNFTFKTQDIRDMSRGSFSNGTGKRLAFNGMIDALNFFDSHGWEYVNQYAVSVGQTNVYHILLRRES
jgi:hypothetical protein